MKKNIIKIFIILILVSASFLFLYIKKEPVDKNDLLPIVKIAGLLILSYYLKSSLKDEKFQIDFRRLSFWGILVYKLSFFLCGFIFLDYSIFLYHNYLIWKALFFFITGVLFLLIFIYSFLDDKNKLVLTPAVYKQSTVKQVIFKIFIAICLAFLGTFFIKANKTMLAIITYLFLTIQLVLIFRLKSGPIIVYDDKNNSLYGNNIGKKLLLLFVFPVSLFFCYLSLIFLQNYNIYFSIVYFLLGTLFMGFTLMFQTQELKNNTDIQNNKLFDVIYCIFIFTVSIIIFSWKLLDVPPGIHGDETLSVNMARQLAAKEVFPVILEYDAYNGMGLLYYLFISWAGKIFGINLLTGRWLSIIVGATEVVFVYLLVKDLFNRRTAIIASIFLSVFFMQIFYSRMVLQWIWVPAFATIAYYFFFKGLKTSNPLYFIISGIIISISLGFYSAAKVSPFVPLLFIIILLIIKDKRNFIINNWQGIFLMYLTLLLTFLPIIDYMINFPDKYFKRMGYVGLLQHFPVNFGEWQILITNIIKNIQMFFTESAVGYCHNLPSKPFLEPYSAFLVIVGMGYLFITIKREESLFLILWLFFGFLPGFLSHLGPEDPYPARTVMIIPAMMITLSLGLETILNVIENFNKRIFRYITPFIALFFFIVFSFYNLRNYFIIFPKDPHTLVYYRYADKLNYDYIKKNKDKYFFIFSWFFSSNYYFGMFDDFLSLKNKQCIFIDDVSLFELYKIYNPMHKDVSISGEGIYYRMFPIYKEYFPNTKIDVTWDTNFWQFDKNSDIKYCYEWKYPDKTIDLNNEYEWFYVYDPMVRFVSIVRAEIPIEDIDKNFSLKGEFYRNDIKIKEENLKFPINIGIDDFNKAVISGLIEIPDYGVYEFLVNSSSQQLYIDGIKINKPIELYKGLHKIKLIVNKNNGQYINLKWKRDGQEKFDDIENKFFINSDKIFGLLATYKFKDKIIYKELQPVIDFRIYVNATRPVYKIADLKECEIEWDGYINIKDNDIYNFKLHNLNDAKIVIDGKVVFVKENNKEKIIPVKMEKGRKKIKIIRYCKYKDYNWILAHAVRFMYKKSNWNEYAPVTYDMLSP